MKTKHFFHCALFVLGVLFFSCLPLFVNAQIKPLPGVSDTLFLQTNRGIYWFDIASRQLRPGDTSLPRLSHSKSTESVSPHFGRDSISYHYEKRDSPRGSFKFWSMMIHQSGVFSRECMNWNTKPKDSGYILYPLAWSRDKPELVYMYSINGDAVENEQGIFEVNIQTGKSRKILSEEEYIGDILVNQDRTTLFFISPDGLLSSLDLISGKQTTLLASCTVLKMEWLVSNPSIFGGGNSCAVDENQPTLRSPFRPDVSFCVTRIGFDSMLLCDQACEYSTELCSPNPFCEGHCQTGCVNCRNALDMDVLVDNFNNKKVIASAAGFVIHVSSSCPVQGMGQGYGFGFHVGIRHGAIDDESAPETWYSHLELIFVQEGQHVFLGQPIGILGNSQVLDCNGDGILDCDCESDEGAHLHYEYHDGSGTQYATSDIRLPVFVDVGGSEGCVVQPNNSYVAGDEEMPASYVYGTTSAQVIYDISCGEESFVTFIGQTCGCCTSYWQVLGTNLYQDTITLPIVDELISFNSNGDPQIVVYRIVNSPCAAESGFAEIFAPLAGVFDDCLQEGCTNPLACNYDAEAMEDDGTCDYSCTVECTDADLNQDSVVNMQDLIIFFSQFGSDSSLGDFDQDGQITTADLFVMLVYFGDVCP